jgi:hypothetical protein
MHLIAAVLVHVTFMSWTILYISSCRSSAAIFMFCKIHCVPSYGSYFLLRCCLWWLSECLTQFLHGGLFLPCTLIAVYPAVPTLDSRFRVSNVLAVFARCTVLYYMYLISSAFYILVEVMIYNYTFLFFIALSAWLFKCSFLYDHTVVHTVHAFTSMHSFLH